MKPAAGQRSGYRIARDRGCEYLLRQRRSDGGFGPEERGLADCYKVAMAFAACGETCAAHGLCHWIRRHGMSPDGDFGPRPEEARGYYYAYYNSWVILGAQRIGQYDLSQRGMDFLMSLHDPVSGGFYSSATEHDPSTLQDMWVVSGCGQAAVCTGRVEVARGVGRWMNEVMRQQPNFPKQLYSVYSRSGGLHRDATDDIRFVCNADATADQYFFHPGIAAGFLCRLYQSTREAEWLDLAKEYMRHAEAASDYLFRLLRAGKVGWASAVLYTLTGEPKYRDMAIRVGDMLVETQSDHGSWSLAGAYQNDITAEMVVWLDEIDQAV